MNSFGDSSKLTEQASKSYWENHLRHFWRIWKLSIVQCPCWLLNTCQFSKVTQADDFRESAQVWLHAVHGSICKLSVRSKHIFFLSVISHRFQYYTTNESPDYLMQEILRPSEPNWFFINCEQSLFFFFFRFSEGSTRAREKRATRAAAREENRETAPIARGNELCVGLTT